MYSRPAVFSIGSIPTRYILII